MFVYRTDDRHYTAFMASGADTASVYPHVQKSIPFKGRIGFQSCTVAVTLLDL